MSFFRSRCRCDEQLVPFLVVGLVACGSALVEQRATVGQRTVVPVNIAHRGASAYAPEHTLEAYQLAIEMGADFVEQDLQLTKDGILVCLHDSTLERTTDVEQRFPQLMVEVQDGDLIRQVWRVSDLTLAQIKELDAGTWFGEEFRGAQVPTLQEAIDLIRGRAGIYPETKDPEAYEVLGFNMEGELIRVLAENGLGTAGGQTATPVFIQSFSADSLRRVRALVSDTYPLVQLVGLDQAEIFMSDRGLVDVSTYAAGVGPALSILLADPTRTIVARRIGLQVHPYTVRATQVPMQFPDATAYMSYLFSELGATGVFTDNPDLFPQGVDRDAVDR